MPHSHSHLTANPNLLISYSTTTTVRPLWNTEVEIRMFSTIAPVFHVPGHLKLWLWAQQEALMIAQQQLLNWWLLLLREFSDNPLIIEAVRVRQQPRPRSSQYRTRKTWCYSFGATRGHPWKNMLRKNRSAMKISTNGELGLLNRYVLSVPLAPTVFRLLQYYFFLASRAGCTVVLSPSISRTTSSIISRSMSSRFMPASL